MHYVQWAKYNVCCRVISILKLFHLYFPIIKSCHSLCHDHDPDHHDQDHDHDHNQSHNHNHDHRQSTWPWHCSKPQIKDPSNDSVQFYTSAADVSSSFRRRLGSSPWLLIVSSSETFQSGTPRCSNIYISPFFVCHHHHRGHQHQLSSSSSWLLLSSEPSWLKFDWFDCSPLSNILLACFNFWLLPPGSS